MHGKVISTIKRKLGLEVCGVCSYRLTKERVTLRVNSDDGGRRVTVCVPCGELAQKPREEIQRLIDEAKEEIMNDQNEMIKTGKLLQ